MKIGDVVKVKEIDANISRDKGKYAIVIAVKLNDHGKVCKLHFFDNDYRFNEYHEGRLEKVNE